MKKTVLITGASSGIGRATAAFFHERGWNVSATMRSPEKSDLHPGENLFLARLDVTDPDSIRAAIAATLARFGRIDALVNNAGYGLVGPFEASDPRQVERQFATNVFGVMNTVREILPLFRTQHSGIVINIASIGGRITFPLYSLYHGTKWAVEGFSESLHYELEPHNIRVKIVEPGPIRTDFYERSMEVMSKPGLTAYDEFVARAMPNLQNAGATAPGPDVVATVVYRAATDNSSRMRYSANDKGLLTLRKLLPDAAFFGVIKKALLR